MVLRTSITTVLLPARKTAVPTVAPAVDSNLSLWNVHMTRNRTRKPVLSTPKSQNLKLNWLATPATPVQEHQSPTLTARAPIPMILPPTTALNLLVLQP